MTETYETLTVDARGAVTVVTLDRPPVNAVNRTMQLELAAAFESFADDRTVHAVVLTGSGRKAFCAGIDLTEVSSGSEDQRPVPLTLDAGHEWRRAQHAVHHCAVPVVAAVEGYVIGAGFGLAGVCDLIVAAEDARFALTEINVGLLGGASKAIRMLGPYRARRMLFGGELESAHELHRLGAVEEVVASGTAAERAVEIAQVFASKSPLALRLAKESILRIEGGQMEAQYRTEQDYTARMRALHDSTEAMRAFAEKREPHWTWS
ncbi:enoyl-CoA hydratase [Nocardioides marinisabuli]|uniref:Enoyl-CoA hydratase n=1 Tax=Nocardioides marinisabuli TaxID=419476 RepID=A0A7Y9JR23_9ACTN|nr:enoyl-CoA hydratase-related protein [Nocardioides marinisabuli]NYD57173.1 enoyl-CoA hydratase [Nocardioides marinisabuli]